MATATSLALLKTDLGLPSTISADLSTYLGFLLDSAAAEISAAGAALRSPDGDDELLIMYAAWLYRKRVNGEGMGLMLSRALANRRLYGAVSEAPS